MKCFVIPQTQEMYAVMDRNGEVRPDGFGMTAEGARAQFIERHRLSPELFELAGYSIQEMTDIGAPLG